MYLSGTNMYNLVHWNSNLCALCHKELVAGKIQILYAQNLTQPVQTYFLQDLRLWPTKTHIRACLVKNHPFCHVSSADKRLRF